MEEFMDPEQTLLKHLPLAYLWERGNEGHWSTPSIIQVTGMRYEVWVSKGSGGLHKRRRWWPNIVERPSTYQFLSRVCVVVQQECRWQAMLDSKSLRQSADLVIGPWTCLQTSAHALIDPRGPAVFLSHHPVTLSWFHWPQLPDGTGRGCCDWQLPSPRRERWGPGGLRDCRRRP